jgi:hypothetical protein
MRVADKISTNRAKEGGNLRLQISELEVSGVRDSGVRTEEVSVFSVQVSASMFLFPDT